MKCRACKQPFTKVRPLQVACGLECALQLAQVKREKEEAKQAKAERVRTREAKLAIKTRAQWMREAQQAFNAWTRKRDEHLPCISCGRFHQGQWHAGHYLSTGARPELRFDERNVHKQCQPCNTHLHGNLVSYRSGLIARLGLGVVESLEGPHQPAKWAIEDLKKIVTTYRAKTRELEKA